MVGDETRAFLKCRKGQFIGGDWRFNDGAADLPVIDSATEIQISTLKEATAADVAAAVEAANAAFDTGSPWRRCGPHERERLLHALANAIVEDAEVLADLISAELGAPRTAARFFEVEKSAEALRYYAGFPTKISGRTIDVGPELGGGEFFCYTVDEPVGVVGAIIPWNAPLLISTWKLGPALAAGCTIVLKPSEEASLVVLRLAELIKKVGFPDGVVNVIVGRGETVGNTLLAQPGIDKFAFTGSTSVGKHIHKVAADRMVRLGLELGGKSPVIVLDDVDIDAAAPGIAMGIFVNSGQVCVAGSRVFAHRSIAKELSDKVAAFAKALKVGNGFASDTQIGPLVSKTQFRRVLDYIELGKQGGARVLAGGASPAGAGYYISPTVLIDLPPASRLLTEEIFGPVMTIEPFDDVSEIVARTNAADYGLAAYIWGTNHGKIQKVARDLRVGTVYINTTHFPPVGVPTGGFRQSGVGRDLGLAGLNGFLESKSVIARIG